MNAEKLVSSWFRTMLCLGMVYEFFVFFFVVLDDCFLWRIQTFVVFPGGPKNYFSALKDIIITD